MEKELRKIFDKNNVGYGEIDVDNAIKDILALFGVDTCSPIGAKVQIKERICGHEYEIGEVVTIIGHIDYSDKTTSWVCININGKVAFVSREECTMLK